MATVISRELTSFPIENEVGGYKLRGRVERHSGLVDLSGMVEKGDEYVGRFSYVETGRQMKIELSVNDGDINGVKTVIKESLNDIKNGIK